MRPGVALGAIVTAAVVVWGAAALSVSAPWIFVDELIYGDLAKSIAAGSAPAVRGVTTFGYGLVYPIAIAPAWLFHDLGQAYAVAHVVNTVLMSLAAVPSYFLARRFVSERSALLVAGLSVLIPSMVYVTVVMTEVAFYPAFLFALLAIQRALERSSLRRQAVAVAAVGVATETKVLAIGLLAAWAVAAILLDGGKLRAVARLRTSMTRLAVPLGCGVVGLLALVGLGHGPVSIFGAYSGAIRHLDLGALPLSFERHLGSLLLSTAVVPCVATAVVVVLGFRSTAAPSLRSFAALALPTIVSVVGGVAVFAVYASGIDYESTGVPSAMPVYERNLFVLAPLVFIGLAAWIESGMPRPRILTWAAGFGSVAILASYPWSQIPRDSASPQNLATIPWLIVPVSAAGRGVLVALVALGVVGLWFRVRPESAGRIWLFLAAWFAVVALLAFAVFAGASSRAARDGKGPSASWIDRAVPSGSHVSVIWPESSRLRFALPRARQRVVWMNEFFNRSVDRVYALGARLPFGLQAQGVRRSAQGALVSLDGSRIRAAYVLAPCALRVNAPAVAVDRRLKVAVYRTAGAVVLGGASRCGHPS